jgi:hypothetical protein
MSTPEAINMLAWVCLRLWNSLRGAHAAPIPGQIIRRERLALNRGEDERLSLNLAKPELKSKCICSTL